MSDRWESAFREMLASVTETGRAQVGFMAGQAQASVVLRLDVGTRARARSIAERLPPSVPISGVRGHAEVGDGTLRLELRGASQPLGSIVEDLVSEVGETQGDDPQLPADPFERVLGIQARIRGVVVDDPERRSRWNALLGSEPRRSPPSLSPQLHRRTGEERDLLRILLPCASDHRAAAIARMVATMMMHADVGGLEEELGQVRSLCYSPRMGAINVGNASFVIFEATSPPASGRDIAEGLHAVAARSAAAVEQNEHCVAMLRRAVLFGLLDEGSIHGDVVSLLQRWTLEEGGVVDLLSLPSELRRTRSEDLLTPLRNIMDATTVSGPHEVF